MIYQISSGQGPAECELGVAKMLGYLKRNYALDVLSTSKGHYDGTYRSVRFYTEEDLSRYIGSVQWICQSPFRPQHKRKNWFLDFSLGAVAETEQFDPDQIVFETFHCGGKGGQNVNKVESGVRAIYKPADLAVECTEERSQHANKQKAAARLRQIVEAQNKQARAAAQNNDWRRHTAIQRGGAAAVFTGVGFLPREKT